MQTVSPLKYSMFMMPVHDAAKPLANVSMKIWNLPSSVTSSVSQISGSANTILQLLRTS